MTAAFEPGQRVRFTYHHGETEDGVVSSTNDRYVFVIFPGCIDGQACDPSMLKALT